MDDEGPESQEVLTNSSENIPLATEKVDVPIMTSASPSLVEPTTQSQYILVQKQQSAPIGTQIGQPTIQQTSVSFPQPLKGQNITILQPQMIQKGKIPAPRPLIALSRPGFLPVQVTQGQAIIINSIGQNTVARCPILPKGASPEKSGVQTSVTKQVFMPVSLASVMSSSTTLTVRPIAPRFAAAILQGAEADKTSRTQTTFVPRAIAPQPRQILIPTQVGQGGPVVLRPNNLNTSSLKNLTSNVLRIQGPSGQMMQAVITTPLQSVQSSNTQESITVNNLSKGARGGDEPINGSDLAVDAKPVKKPCNCTKSQCLKLYCDCFASGEFCSNCNCHNCSNNIQHEAERSKAIKACLERNPSAFHPKIGKTRGVAERRHTKGCHCKRSGCLKNYCECYEAKIMCSTLCKCTGCKNFEESPERKTLMHLADAAEVRVLQQNAARSKLESQLEAATSKSVSATSEKRLPFTYITTPVVNATCECLMARAEEAELNNMTEQNAERLLLDEFGRSLLQIIQTANKSKDYSV